MMKMIVLNNNDDDKIGDDWERRSEKVGQIEGVKGKGERKKEQSDKIDWKNLYRFKVIIYVLSYLLLRIIVCVYFF